MISLSQLNIGLAQVRSSISALYWTLPAWPTVSGTVSYVTNGNGSGAGSFAQALIDRAAGGVIAIDPAVTVPATTITSNPSAMVYVTTGTSGGGLVNQTGQAIDYAKSTRGTITSIAFNSVSPVTNLTFVSVNFGSTSNFASGSSLIAGEVASNGIPSLYCYGCEFFGPTLSSSTYGVVLTVGDTTGYTVSSSYTGTTSGTVCTVLAKTGTTGGTLLVNVTSIPGPGTQALPFTIAETLGPSTVSAQAALNTYGVQYKFNTVTIQGCYFHEMANGIKASVALDGSTVEYINNDFDLLNNDAMHLPPLGGITVTSVTMAFNRMTRPIGLSGDVANPHCDFIQIATTTDTIKELNIFGNVCINGFTSRAPGSTVAWAQGLFVGNDITTGKIFTKAVGNKIVYYGLNPTANQFEFDNVSHSYLFGNILARQTPGSGSGHMVQRLTNSITGIYNSYNTYENDGNSLDSNGNYNLSNTDVSYEAVLGDGSGNSWPLTAATHTAAIAEVISKVKPLSTGPFGILTTYVDYTNKKINTTLEPKKIVFGTKAGQTVSATDVTSGWFKYWNKGSAPISVSNGKYQLASDYLGNGATALTTAAGTVSEGQWVQMAINNASTAGTLATATLTVGSTSNTYSTVTTSADTFTGVSNGGTAYANAPASGSAITARKGIIAMRIAKAAIANNVAVSDNTTAAGTTIYFPAGTTYRFRIGGTTRQLSCANAAFVNDGATYTTIITWFDTSYADSTGARVVVDGTEYAWTANAWATASSVSIANTFPKVFDDASGTNIMQGGKIKFLWAHFWDGTTGSDPFAGIDIANPAFWSKFYSEQIGADGSGPLGASPMFYYTGNAAYWNGGATNLGTNSANTNGIGAITKTLTATGTWT